jgi:hypothetical protein
MLLRQYELQSVYRDLLLSIEDWLVDADAPTRRRLIRLMHKVSQNLAHVRDVIDMEIEGRR